MLFRPKLEQSTQLELEQLLTVRQLKALVLLQREHMAGLAVIGP